MSLTFSIDLPGMMPARDYLPIARHIEELGFDELHVFDDLMQRPAWPMLSLIGANTETLRLGPTIISPRIVHPAYHAANLAVLDELTDGRAVCAVGRGAFFEWLGLEPPDRPFTMLREAFEVMRRVLRGDTTPFDGEIFSTTEALALAFPTPRPDIPIWLGTFGPKTCELAGEIADGAYIGNLADATHFRTLRDRIATGATRVGRDPATLEIAAGPICMIGPDRSTANDLMRPLAAQALDWLHPLTEAAGVTPAQLSAVKAAVAAGDHAAAAGELSDEVVEFFALTGTPDDVIPRIQALVDAGANHIAFATFPTPTLLEQLTLIAQEIIPAVGATEHAP
jgi:5,10-methylenetetrahydromethanopterin reductase